MTKHVARPCRSLKGKYSRQTKWAKTQINRIMRREGKENPGEAPRKSQFSGWWT